MSRKDYQEAAAILAKYRDNVPHATLEAMVDDFAAMFARDNSRFHKPTFVVAWVKATLR